MILNEILLAEGFGTLDMPDINLSALAPIPLDQQLALGLAAGPGQADLSEGPIVRAAERRRWQHADREQ
nr:hypothetical protein GCM10017611_33140 [Rhodococcus wratislaviensis]